MADNSNYESHLTYTAQSDLAAGRVLTESDFGSLQLSSPADQILVYDDGSCLLGGCMDSRFDAFDSLATFDDGSCPTVLPGCMQSDASNYCALATIEEGSCLYQGCLDSSAINHDPSATLPGECVGVVTGCLDSLAINFYT